MNGYHIALVVAVLSWTGVGALIALAVEYIRVADLLDAEAGHDERH